LLAAQLVKGGGGVVLPVAADGGHVWQTILAPALPETSSALTISCCFLP
jgi:hypothetical protein